VASKVPTTSPNGAFPEDSFKYSPLEHVRSLFVGFFQGLFAASPPGAYHWEEDHNISEICIADEAVVKSSEIGARPAISFTRGPVQFYSLGLDDMMAYDFRTGKKRKTVLVPGTMTINCSSRVSLESERIAWICAEQLWLHREMLMKMGFFEIGRQPAIGSPSAAGSIVVADEGDEWYVTSVSCPYQFYRTSQYSPLGAKIVRDITLSMNVRTPTLDEQGLAATATGHGGPPATSGAGLPYEIQVHPPPPFAPAASDVNGGTPNPGFGPPSLPVVPNPRNPAQYVTVRAARPNSPAVRPPGMGGVAIPIAPTDVEESVGNQRDAHGQYKRTVKVR
jgi:hypothetical protein